MWTGINCKTVHFPIIPVVLVNGLSFYRVLSVGGVGVVRCDATGPLWETGIFRNAVDSLKHGGNVVNQGVVCGRVSTEDVVEAVILLHDYDDVTYRGVRGRLSS